MDASSRAAVLSARSAVGASSLAAAAALVAVSVSTTMAPPNNDINRNTSSGVAAAAAAPAATTTAATGAGWEDGGGVSLFPGPSPWPAEGWKGDGNDSDGVNNCHGGGGSGGVGNTNTSPPFILNGNNLSRHGYVDEHQHPPGVVKQEIGEGGHFSRGGVGKAKRGGGQRGGGRGRPTLGSRPVRKKERAGFCLLFFHFF